MENKALRRLHLEGRNRFRTFRARENRDLSDGQTPSPEAACLRGLLDMMSTRFLDYFTLVHNWN